MVIEKTKNKLNFLFIKKDIPTVTILVLVRGGTEYENKENNGISHFLEHLCFKGTKNFPSYQELLSEFDKIGIDYNAFTSYQYIGYYAKSSFENFPKVVFLVSDILINPIFPESEIEKEKGVVIEEINLYKDTPARYIQDLFLKALYGDQPAGWLISGSEKNIKKIKRKDILKFYSKIYTAPNILVVVAGNIKNKSIDFVIEKFSKVRQGERSLKSVFKEPKLPNFIIHKKQTNQIHVGVGFLGFPLNDLRFEKLEILANLIGGMMSSRMFEKIREKMGAAYYIRTENEGLSDHGFIATFAGLKNELFLEALNEILNVYKETKVKISDEELERAISNFIGRFYLSLETSDDLARFYGLSKFLKGKIEEPTQIIKRIKKIKKQDLINLAREVFRKERLSLSLIGQVESKTIRKLIENFD